MEQMKIAKQMIDFQKATFNNTFDAIVLLQDQAEKAMNMFVNSAGWPIPEEGKKLMNEWAQAFKKGRDEFKKNVDENFKRMEGFCTAEKS